MSIIIKDTSNDSLFSLSGGELEGAYSQICNGVLLDDVNMVYLREYIIGGTGNLHTLIIGNNAGSFSGLYKYPFNLGIIKGLGETVNQGYLYSGGERIKHNNDVRCNSIEKTFSLFYLGYKLITTNDELNKSFLDYSGYTTIEVYLPYYGTINLSPEDVMYKYVTFFISIEFLTGSASYMVYVSDIEPEVNPAYVQEGFGGASILTYSNLGNLVQNGRFLCHHDFQLGVPIPLGKSNATEVARNQIWSGISSFMNLATFGTGGIARTTSYTSPSTYEVSARGTEKGSRLKTVYKAESTGKTKTTSTQYGNPFGKMFDVVADTARGVLNNASSTQSSPMTCSTASFVRENSIHIIIRKAKTKEIDYAHEYGRPLGERKRLSSVYGYTEISSIHLEGDGFKTCSEEEQQIITKLISEGVIL